MASNKAPLGRRSVPGPLVVDRRLFKRSKEDLKRENLTPNQLEVIKWIMDGKRTEEIGQLMQMTPAAVQQHVYRIMEVTGTNSRVAVVVFALRRGLLTLSPLMPDDHVRNHTNDAIPKPIA